MNHVNMFRSIFVVLACSVPTVASGELLNTRIASRLCEKQSDGEILVNRDKLASLLVSQADPLAQLYVNDMENESDGGIYMSSGQTAPAYAVYHSGEVFPLERNRPFGPDVPLLRDDGTLEAHNAIWELVTSELQPLVEARREDGQSTQAFYVKTAARLRPVPTTDELDDPRSIFAPVPPLVIACNLSSTAKPAAEQPATANEVSSELPVAFRLRGDVKDLHERRDASGFDEVKPARLSFMHDGEASSTTLGVTAVAGWEVTEDILGMNSYLSLIPFLSVEVQEADSEDDIFKVAPGFLIAHAIETPEYAVHSRGELSWIADLEQGSDQGKVRLYVDPAFSLYGGSTSRDGNEATPAWGGSARGILFGSQIGPYGPFLVRPDMTLIGDLSWVADDGNSPELEGASIYGGLGGEADLQVRLYDSGLASEFVVGGGLRYLQLFGDIDEPNTHRWFAALSYEPSQLPYFGVDLTYSNGDNPDTLQEEDRVELGFSLRF